jgi:hypothetical protein
MLKVVIPSVELFNQENQQFFNTKEQELQLEHSLVSLSKWESKWMKPFLTKTDKTIEETIDYVRCMTLTQNVDPIAYKYLTQGVLDQISTYIDAPMTATTFRQEKQAAGAKEVITAEIIYYWMISFNIPFECQKWHLNRLLALINVCNIKNQPKKKLSQKELLARNRALNEERRAKYNTRG